MRRWTQFSAELTKRRFAAVILHTKPITAITYPHAVNEKFFLGQEEDDFQLDGYCIRKLSQLKKVEIRDDKCCEINRLLGTTAQLARPAVDIESWERIFQSLSALDSYVQIEDALHGEYAIGVIERVLKTKLLLKSFDADGLWCEEGIEIPYGEITSVKWGTRYDRGWKRYFEELNCGRDSGDDQRVSEDGDAHAQSCAEREGRID